MDPLRRETSVKKMLLSTVLLAAACGPRETTVTLGAAGPWDASYGAMNRRGIELAVEELNARRPERQLRIDFRNDSGSGARAAVIAQRFVDDPEILGVIGHVTSGAMVSAAKVYNGNLAAVATSASSPDLTGISPWVFRVISSDSANGIEIARWAARQGITRAAILYENTSYGRGLADAFRSAFRGEVLGMDPIDEGAAQDFEPHVSYYSRLAPQLVFVAGTEESGIAFLREARRQRLASRFVGGDGWTGINIDTAAAEGAYVGAPFSARDPRPAAQAFVTAFRTRYGMEPDGNAALAYDATMLLSDAVDAAGGSRTKVRDYLHGVQGDRRFEGVTGTIAFTDGGDPRDKQIVMARMQRGILAVEAP